VAVVPLGSEVLLPSAGDGAGGSVQVLENLPGRLVLQVDAGEAGLLVVSQVFYPGWRATVDGQTVPIHRADQLLQGLRMNAGAHRVELSYHLSFWPVAISVAVLIVCAIVLVLHRRRV
jgi:uncharacterized membrane protein YfhO